MLLTVFVAIAVPVAFLYALHWLDLYGTDRPRIVLVCVAWGLVAFLLSFAVNRYCIDILGFPRSFVSTRTAPFFEEIFKALVLFELVRRNKLAYAVDGAIYGFASGIGFAIIENVRYTQLFPDNPLALVVVRDFSSALSHSTSTALVGISLGALAIGERGRLRYAVALPGLLAAMTIHYLWNNFSYHTPFDRFATEWILVGVGLAGVALVAAAIMWGLRRERGQLRDLLGMDVGVSGEEASVVLHMDDLDRLLAPIRARFGHAKCRQVAQLLHTEAQLGLAKRCVAKAADPAWRAALADQMVAIERDIDQRRQAVGLYVMLYVRTIFPETAWSLWARLQHALENGGDASGGARAESLYSRIDRALDARRAAAMP